MSLPIDSQNILKHGKIQTSYNLGSKILQMNSKTARQNAAYRNILEL